MSTAAGPGAPALVLVHGLGVSSRYMLPAARVLAQNFRVNAVDLPGFGLSSKPPQALAVPALAAALGAWIEESALEPPILVANSFGCQVSAELAATRPEVARGLVLLAPTVDPDARSVRTHLGRWLLTVPFESPSLQPVILRDYRDAGLARVRQTVQLALDHRIEQRLPHVGVPVLVVRGGRDRVVPQRWAEQAAELAPHGRLSVVPRGAHCLNFSSPHEVATLVRAFADDLPPV